MALFPNLLPREGPVPDLALVEGPGHVAASPAPIAPEELDILHPRLRREGVVGLHPIKVDAHPIRCHRHGHVGPLVRRHGQATAPPPGTARPMVAKLVVLAEVEAAAGSAGDDHGRVVRLDAVRAHPGHGGERVGIQAEVVGQAVAIGATAFQRHARDTGGLALARRSDLHHGGDRLGIAVPRGVGHGQRHVIGSSLPEDDDRIAVRRGRDEGGLRIKGPQPRRPLVDEDAVAGEPHRVPSAIHFRVGRHRLGNRRRREGEIGLPDALALVAHTQHRIAVEGQTLVWRPARRQPRSEGGPSAGRRRPVVCPGGRHHHGARIP